MSRNEMTTHKHGEDLYRIRLSVFVKFTLIISICLIVLFSVIGFILTGLQERALIEEKEKSARTLTKQVADISATPIKTFAFFALDENAVKLQASPDILSVMVYGNSGIKLTPSGIEQEQIKVPQKYWLEQESVCLYTPPSGEAEAVGKVIMIFSLQSIYNQVAQMRLLFSGIITITVMVVDAIVILLLMLIVTKPLKILTTSAQQLSSGDFNILMKPPTHTHHDEIGFLSVTFVKMSRKLKENFETIKEYNESLEREIIERKRAEQTLVQERNLLRTLIDNLPDYIYIKDTNGRFVLANKASIHSLNRTSVDELVGKTDFDLFPQELAEQFYVGEREVFESGLPIIAREERNLDLKTGEMRWIATTKAPFHDSYGNVVGIVGLSRDITERKQNEEELRKYRQHLEELVQERTNELSITNEHLRHEIMKREQAEQALKEHNRQLALLNHMSELLQTCATEKETYTIVTNVYKALFPEDAGYLGMINKLGTILDIVGYWGEPPPKSALHVDECWVLRYGKRDCGYELGHPCPYRSTFIGDRYLCIPIRASDELLGILSVHFKQTPFSGSADENEGMINAIRTVVTRGAEQYAWSLANLRLRETLRMESIHDALTGLYNRRYMEEALEREAHRANRHNTPVGIIMLDIDHFKNFNDTHGHEAGDMVLRALGAFLRHHIRREDTACRYGGEEFLLIMPEAKQEITKQRAEELRVNMAKLAITYQDKVLHFTVSLGVAILPDHGHDMKDIVKAADTALYRAKIHGRNQVMIAARDSHEPWPIA